ncbi:MAG: hypothetical protein AAF193_01285 [Bacteroidota bacterium]
MKTKISLLVMALLMVVTASAQDKVVEALAEKPQMTVTTNDVALKKEEVNAYTAYVKADPNLLEKEWKSFMKEFHNVEMKNSKGVLAAEETKIVSITQDIVYLYTKISKDEEGARMDVMLRMGGKYVDDSAFPNESAKLRAIVNKFLHDFYVQLYDDVIDDQRKEQDKLTKEYEKMVKAGEKLVKESEGKEADIAKAEENIIKTEKLIADSQIKIEQLKADIENYKKEIENLKKEQEDNKTSQGEAQTKVDEQGKRIEKLKQNADAIR